MSANKQIDRPCDEFEKFWKTGDRVRLGRFVNEAACQDKLALVLELIPVEIEY